MLFPDTNKISQQMPEDSIESNAKLLEQLLSKANWKRLLSFYFTGLGILLITIFSILVVIRLAINL